MRVIVYYYVMGATFFIDVCLPLYELPRKCRGEGVHLIRVICDRILCTCVVLNLHVYKQYPWCL